MGVAVGVAAVVAAAVGDGVAVLPVSPNEGVFNVGVGVKVKDPGLDWPGLAVPVLVGVGVLKGMLRYGLGETVIGDGLGTAVAAEVAAGVSVGVSVGVAGRGMNGVGTSLAWLAGPGEAYAGGLLVGLLGAGAGAEGQRLQVAAQ